jgi:serine/threonine-protein kinase ULK4
MLAALDKLRVRLHDENEQVRRLAMITLGELLFYMCSGESAGGLSAMSVAESTAHATVDAVLHLLQPSEDTIAQNYACKAIDNVLAKSGFWPNQLAVPRIAKGLLKVWFEQCV